MDKGARRAISLFLCIVMMCGIFTIPAAAEEAAGTESGGPNVAAKSAILMEASTGKVLFEKDADAFLNPASVTKIMTLLLIMEAIDAGKIGWEDMVSVSETAASMGGSQIWLEPGETMSVHDLVKAICIVSANDAAYAMAEQISGSGEAFVNRMNERAKELGCTNTDFKNPTGLDAEGHGTSARDIALMSRELIKHKEIREFTLTWMDSLRDGKNELVNTNKLIKTYKGITGLKTGSTSSALYCLSATAERDGMELIAVVLASPTTKDRFNDATTLLDYGYANYQLLRPELPELAPIPVTRGIIPQVSLKVKDENFTTLADKSGDKQIECEVQVAENLTAPVEAEQTVGTVVFSCNGEKIGESPIVTTESVERTGFIAIFFDVLSGVMPS